MCWVCRSGQLDVCYGTLHLKLDLHKQLFGFIKALLDVCFAGQNWSWQHVLPYCYFPYSIVDFTWHHGGNKKQFLSWRGVFFFKKSILFCNRKILFFKRQKISLGKCNVYSSIHILTFTWFTLYFLKVCEE